MSGRKELCRNFQRGSCHYGDRCKFLHVSQPGSGGIGSTSHQQSNPFGFGTGATGQQQRLHQQSNPFGFGTGVTNEQQRQQKQSNPFGFGVQSGQVQGASPFAVRHESDYQRPSGNKWIRSVNAPPAKQSESQSSTGTHICKDPNECKRLIVEDLKNERPLWKLSCYGHFKGLPCDIGGDVSYEELRAAAYDDAVRGLSLQSIVERERNLLNSKLLEFDKLLNSPYVAPKTQATAIENPFSNNSISPARVQDAMAFQALSHGQLRSLPSSNIGQPSPFQDLHVTNGFLGDYSQKSPGGPSDPNAGFAPAQNKMLSALSSSTTTQHSNMLGGSGTVGLISTRTPESKAETTATDKDIWLKNKWMRGEIPREEPPSKYCVD